MRQFIGSIRDHRSVHDLLLSVAPERIRRAAAQLVRAERALGERDDEPAQLRYAHMVTEYVEAGGYDLEVVWDAVTTAALGLPYERAGSRDVNTLSGGEQKRLVLAALLRGPDQLLLLDEPDNYLDVPGKQWLERQLQASTKTVLLVSHDRQLLAEAADRIVTVEDRQVWVHGAGFASYPAARRARIDQLDDRRRRWDDEHARLRHLVHTARQGAARNDALASAYRAARSRLARFEEAGPPTRPPKEQNVRIRLRGGRTGKQALICQQLELTGLMKPFDLEVWYGERVAVLGSNGSGKSQFLRLLASTGQPDGQSVAHRGTVRLGARVVPGLFAQTHARPDLYGGSGGGRPDAGVVAGQDVPDRARRGGAAHHLPALRRLAYLANVNRLPSVSVRVLPMAAGVNWATDATGPVLTFTPYAWRVFLGDLPGRQ